ncbi:25202_t:CDS:2, partial [Gigaspora margarita]
TIHSRMLLFLFVTINRESYKPSKIISETLYEIESSKTFGDLLYLADNEYKPNEIVRVEVRCSGSNQYHFYASGVEGSLHACEPDLRNISYVRFFISDFAELSDSSDSQSNISSNNENVFDLMMNSAQEKKLPLLKDNNNKRNQLFNDLINSLYKMDSTIGEVFLNKLTTFIWYIDEHHSKFSDRSLYFSDFIRELIPYKNNQFYKKDSHHKKGLLERTKLELYIDAIKESLDQPWANNSTVELKLECHFNEVKEQYHELATIVKNLNNYEVISIDEYLPLNCNQRYKFITNLALDTTIILYRYYHRNYLGTLNFIWRIPTNPNIRSENLQAQAIISIQNKLPKYFTRAM